MQQSVQPHIAVTTLLLAVSAYLCEDRQIG